MKSRALGQNFLRNQRTARRLAYMAGVDDGTTCVDIGAGSGMITEASLRRTGPVVSIEVDPRLVRGLRDRFAAEPRVTVVEGDLATAPLPQDRFVIAANPPFNQSTTLARRWLLAPNFTSGALIVESRFAGRVSGAYGATKLSLSFGPYLEFIAGPSVRANEFSPQPRVPTTILAITRKDEPPVRWGERLGYWLFVNYLFERSQRTVGDALSPLRYSQISSSLRNLEIRSLSVDATVALFLDIEARLPTAAEIMRSFDRSLPHARRVSLGATDASTPGGTIAPRPPRDPRYGAGSARGPV